MQPLRLAVFLAFVAGLRAYELSQTLVEFYCVVNGNFSDWEQVEKEGDIRTLFYARIVPVFAPALSPVPVLYMEQTVGGQVLRAHVLIVQEAEEGILYIDSYNLVVDKKIKARNFDPYKVKSLTLKDLQGERDCRKVYVRVAPFVFFINWPSCMKIGPKTQRLSYAVTLTCYKAVLVMPQGAPEKPTLEPYQLKIQGDKYPLEGAPGNFVCHCESRTC